MTMPGSVPSMGSGSDTRNANVVLDAQVQGYVQGTQQAQASTNRFADAVDKLDAKLGSLSKRASTKLIHFSESDFAALSGATATAATFEKQLGTLSATAVVTGQSMGGIKGAIESSFVKFPIARGEVVALTQALSGLGVTGARDLASLTQTFIKLGAATGEPMGELASGLTQLSRLMGTTGSGQIANYANSLLTVSKTAGVSATGVLSFAQSIAPLARQAGIGQAAVLGISAAFSKAGADGFVAANTFNSIVGDITNLTQSGSPELAKYANLIGKTTAQFKSMDKTTALTDIFTTIARQGPKAITTLNQLGIDGVRAQSAIAGVVQSGNLKDSISQAIGSSHDQKNLTAGSQAAFKGLADSLASLRNNFTQFGTEIGTTFLKPLDAAVSVINRLFSAINMLIKPFAPLIALLAGTAGVIGAVGGAALGAAGIIGTAALARTVIKSGPRRALGEGFRAGRMEAGGQVATDGSTEMFTSGLMPMRARLPYQATRFIGREIFGAPSVSTGPSVRAQAARAAMRGAFRAPAAYMNSTSDMLHDAALNDYSRSAYGGLAAKAAAAANDPRGMFTRARDFTRNAVEENRTNTAHMGALRVLTKESLNLGSAFTRLTAETAKAGVSMGAGMLGSKVGAAGRGVVRVGSALSSAITNPYALIAETVAMGAWSHLQATRKDTTITDDTYLNPVSKYNDALGIATTNLATFSAAVDTAAVGTSNLQGVTANTSLSTAAHVTKGDIGGMQGVKPSDQTISALASAPGGAKNATALKQLAVSYNLTDPRQVQMFKNNALAAGFDPAMVNSSLTAAVQQKQGNFVAQDYSALASADMATQGVATRSKSIMGQIITGPFTPRQGTALVMNTSPTGAKIRQSALSGIGTSYNTNLQYGDDYAAQKRAQDELAFFADMTKSLGGGKEDQAGNKIIPDRGYIQRKEIADALTSTFKGATGNYQSALDSTDFRGMNDTQRQLAIEKVIGSTAEGKTTLAGLTTTDPTQMSATLRRLYGSGELSATREAVQATGPTGKFALTNSTVTNATATPGDLNAQYAGMKALADNAVKVNGGFAGATDALNKLQGAIQNTTDPLYAMADAAKSYISQTEQAALPTMTRAQQSSYASQNYSAALTDYNRGTEASPNAGANLTQAKTAYDQNKEAQRQYLVQTYQMAQQYGTQMERASEDQNTTINRQKQDFYIGQQQQQEDFQKQTMRSTRDFGIQMERQAQSSAQSIYNPYARVSAQYTTDAGTLVQNLQDQNQRIQQQYAQLGQIKKMGVSQNAIDTLQLSDPNNAQQLNNIVGSIAQNPQLVKQINAAVGTRVQATTQLTQSSYNETFRNTVADFTKQMNDTSVDYQTAQTRAVEAQNRSLGRMSDDFNKMVKRSGEDLVTSMTEITGSFADLFPKAFDKVTQAIGKYSPQAAQLIQSQLDALKAANPDFFTNLAGVNINVPNNQGAIAGMTTKQKNAMYGGHAAGGISTFAHVANFSEGNKPEAIIPLDARGLQFMTGFANQVSMAMLRQMNASQHPSLPQGTSASGGGTQIDARTQFTGAITIMANDTAQIQRELAQQARVRKLRSPTASTAGTLA